MTEILSNPTPFQLIRAIEDNTISSLLAWTKWDKIEAHTDGDKVWITSEIPYFLFNLVFPAETSSVDPGRLIDAALAQARSRSASIGCWVGPFNPIPGFGKRLAANGFIHAAEVTGMAVDLNELDSGASMPRELVIRRVASLDDLTTWCELMTTISEFPDFAAAAWLEMYRDIGICDDPNWRLYLAELDGTPVGTSSLFFNAGVAGIHSVTTVPESRGRGIGTALTRSPLLDARSQAIEVGILYSSEMAVSLYSRLGFQEYCRGQIYLWEPNGLGPASQS